MEINDKRVSVELHFQELEPGKVYIWNEKCVMAVNTGDHELIIDIGSGEVHEACKDFSIYEYAFTAVKARLEIY